MNVGAKFRFGLRERIWATVVGAIAVVVVGLTLAFNLVIADRLDHEANSVAAARATAELDALRVTSNGIRLSETFDAGAVDAPTWVFDHARAIEQPRSSRANARAAASRAAGPRGFHDVAATDTRLYALPVVSDGQRVGTVVSAVALGPYERIKRVALIGSILLGVAALIAVTFAARWLIARALRPVGQMTRQAAEWSESDLEGRFSLGEPRDEFTTLAATLDGLLDRVATSLRHEQNLTAELSHELRTPLAQISAEAQYALRHDHGDEVRKDGYRRIIDSASHMSRILDTLISAARTDATPGHARSDAAATAHAAIKACQPLARDHGVEIDLRLPSKPVVVGVASDLLERMLAPLLENACRYARHRITLTIRPNGAVVALEVGDDGPGVSPSDREVVFVPGRRAHRGEVGAASPGVDGAGLGLALARRLARGAGGDVELAAGEGHGATFVITVPRG
jgi:two-component system, OmpR family, sensor kinase